MIPGMNPRDMKLAMKRLGIKQEEISATVVIIKCAEHDIVIMNPSVSKVNMMGQETFQVSGDAQVREREVHVSDEDVQTVIAQTGKGEDLVREMIQKHEGDLAAAILELQDE